MFCRYGLEHTLKFSKRNCFHSAESLVRIIRGGRSADGDREVFFNKWGIWFYKGELDVNLKWCMLVIPFKAVLMVCSSKCSLKLYMDTKMVPYNDPTNCGTFPEEERETLLAICLSLFCGISALVCWNTSLAQTLCAWMVEMRLSPPCKHSPHEVVHHVPILFCLVQLSAWKFTEDSPSPCAFKKWCSIYNAVGSFAHVKGLINEIYVT